MNSETHPQEMSRMLHELFNQLANEEDSEDESSSDDDDDDDIVWDNNDRNDIIYKARKIKIEPPENDIINKARKIKIEPPEAPKENDINIYLDLMCTKMDQVLQFFSDNPENNPNAKRRYVQRGSTAKESKSKKQKKQKAQVSKSLIQRLQNGNPFQ